MQLSLMSNYSLPCNKLNIMLGYLDSFRQDNTELVQNLLTAVKTLAGSKQYNHKLLALKARH